MTQGTFYFDPDDPIYAEHFPGHPVVPGSVIVWAFIQAIEKNGYHFRTINLDHFRFQRFIGPGSYRFSLVLSDDRIKCMLYDNDTTVAKGVILL